MLIPQHSRHAVALVFALTLAAAPRARAQVDDVNRLPTFGRQLRVGIEVSGLLTADDEVWWDDTFVQAWTLMLERGQNVTVDLLSNEFDSFLMVAGPGIEGVMTDDDGGGACNARLSWTAAESGEFRVVVNTIGEGNTGEFLLRATEYAGPVAEGECGGAGFPGGEEDIAGLPVEGRMLMVGQEATGHLSDVDHRGSDGAYMQAWGLAMSAGQRVTVDLVSHDFDSYLWVGGPGMETVTDDDGGGACHSRVTFSAPADGLYRVVASTLSEGETGSFVLRVSTVPPPVVEEECGGGMPGEFFGDIDLTQYPIEGRMLLMGQDAAGSLSSSDRTGPDGAYMQAWGLALSAGQEATVDLLSDDFDAFLWVGGPGLDNLSDDDGAGACHSRVTFTAPQDGLYRVVASTLSEGETGSFVLRVTPQPGPVSTEACGGEGFEGTDIDLALLPVGDRRLSMGSKASGRLTSADTTSSDGSYMQAWGLVMSAGETATVDLISGEFDAYLWIAGPGLEGSLSDDDGGGACNSRITFTAPTDGIYRVVVNSVSAGATGSFRLTVSLQPGPLAPGSCGGGGELPMAQQQAGPTGELDVQPRSLRLSVGERAEVLATLFDASGEPVLSTEFVWESGDPAVVEAEPDPTLPGIAFLTAKGGGVATVRVRAEGLSRSIAVRVVGPSAACTNPGPDYNSDGSCFDRPPSTQDPPLLSVPEGTTERPTPAVLWVKVGTDGSVLEVRRLQDSNNVRFTIAAIQFARESLTYAPAEKAGRPVEAWMQLRVVPSGR